MSQETATSGTASPVPAQPPAGELLAAERVPGPGSGGSDRALTLARLLSVATLTPAQASLVAVRLLHAAAPAADGNGGVAADTCLGAVTLDPRGEVDVAGPLDVDARPLSELLDRLVDNARRLPAHPKPEQVALLRRLEEAAAQPSLRPETRGHQLEQAVAEALGPGAGQRVTAQLAALVDAFARVAPGTPAVSQTGTGAGPPPARASHRPSSSRHGPSAPGPSAPSPSSRRGPGRAAPARVSTPRRSRGRVLLRRRARGRVALVTLVLAGVLAVSGYVALGGPGSDIVGSLGGGGAAPTAPDTTPPEEAPVVRPTKEPKPDRAQAVRRVAPRQAGPITGVTLARAGTCSPGALCPVTVTVHFRPASTSRTIGWKVGTAQVCKRPITWSGLVTVTAQPGWTTVYASSSVRVPKGRKVALTALTTTPARAQSRPVPVGGSSLQC